MKNLNTNESGRSMVEMLGVLAVMGLLTIMGIMGFRYALNRHYANDLLHEVHRVAYSYSGHLLTAGKDAAFDISSVAPSAADASFSLKPYDDYFMVGVEGVEKAVCEQAAGTELPTSFQRRVYCDEGAMEFYFANEMGACDDVEKCALPEVCTEGQNQCGRLCCEQGETCMPGRCCPSGKYIAATNTCCEGDEVAYDTTGQGNYVCKEPENGDNCMGPNGPDQSKCNLSGDEKLYCKVTSNTCPPTSATCQPLPSLTRQPLSIAGNSIGEFVKANEKMDWWSAKNLCVAIGKELPTLASLCNNASNCTSQPTGRAAGSLGLSGWDPWLEETAPCAARTWSWGNNNIMNNREKKSSNAAVCQPIGYRQPQLCDEDEVYNFTTDSCGTPCSSYLTCQQKFGSNYYCRRDINTVDSNCTSEPTGSCQQLPSLTRQSLTVDGESIGEWVKANTAMDWWSAKDLCGAINKEMPTFAGMCNGVTDCKTQPIGDAVRALGLGGEDPWLDETESCQAYRWSVYWGVSILNKNSNYVPVCKPTN